MEEIQNGPEMINKLTNRRKVGFLERKPKKETSSEDVSSLETMSTTSNSIESLSNEKKMNNCYILSNELAEEANKLFKYDKVEAFSTKKKLKSRTMVISRGMITSIIYSKNDDRKNYNIMGSLTLPENIGGNIDSVDNDNHKSKKDQNNNQHNLRNHHNIQIQKNNINNIISNNDSNKDNVNNNKRRTNQMKKAKTFGNKDEINFLDTNYFSKQPFPPIPRKPPKLPPKNNQHRNYKGESKLIIQVRSGGFKKHFKISPNITVKCFLKQILHYIPRLNQFIDHIGGKLTLCLPNNKNYVFRDANEEETFKFLRASSSYFLPPEKTFASMKHIILQAKHLEILPRSGFFKINSQHHNLFPNKSTNIETELNSKSFLSSEDPVKMFQFRPMERGSSKMMNLTNSRISVNMYHATNLLDNTKVMIRKISLKQEKLDFLLQDVITQNIIKHNNIIQLHSIFHRETYGQLWIVEEAFGHSFFDTIRGICPRSLHQWGGHRCSDCLVALQQEDLEDLDSTEDNGSSLGARFNEKSISRIIKQVLLALQVLHHNNKVHRNLHSKSVYINKQNVVKIERFFHPSEEMDEYDRKLILSQHPLPAYIAPELLKYKCVYTPKVDVFSIGILVLELYEGATPLAELEKYELFSTLSKMELTYPEHCSQNLKHFLSVTLNPNPRNRHDVDQLLEHPFLK